MGWRTRSHLPVTGRTVTFAAQMFALPCNSPCPQQYTEWMLIVTHLPLSPDSSPGGRRGSTGTVHVERRPGLTVRSIYSLTHSGCSPCVLTSRWFLSLGIKCSRLSDSTPCCQCSLSGNGSFLPPFPGIPSSKSNCLGPLPGPSPHWDFTEGTKCA